MDLVGIRGERGMTFTRDQAAKAMAGSAGEMEQQLTGVLREVLALSGSGGGGLAPPVLGGGDPLADLPVVQVDRADPAAGYLATFAGPAAGYLATFAGPAAGQRATALPGALEHAPPGKILGCRPDERSLRFGLERCYRAQARLASDRKRRIELVDMANAIRPRTFV